MPCVCLVNSSVYSQTINPGDLTIVRGTANHNDRGVINYWYKYSTGGYFIPASNLTAIPDGATINEIAFEYDLTLATGGTTYTITNSYGFIYQHPTATEFPSGLMNNGYSSTDTAYNNAIYNYTGFLNNPDTYSFTQQTSDPSIRYVSIPFVNSMVYKAGNSIAIMIINNSGAYTGSGSTPGWRGDVTTHSGNYFYRANNDTTGPYSLTGTASRDGTFKPNVKLSWI